MNTQNQIYLYIYTRVHETAPLLPSTSAFLSFFLSFFIIRYFYLYIISCYVMLCYVIVIIVSAVFVMDWMGGKWLQEFARLPIDCNIELFRVHACTHSDVFVRSLDLHMNCSVSPPLLLIPSPSHRHPPHSLTSLRCWTSAPST